MSQRTFYDWMTPYSDAKKNEDARRREVIKYQNALVKYLGDYLDVISERYEKVHSTKVTKQFGEEGTHQISFAFETGPEVLFTLNTQDGMFEVYHQGKTKKVWVEVLDQPVMPLESLSSGNVILRNDANNVVPIADFLKDSLVNLLYDSRTQSLVDNP